MKAFTALLVDDEEELVSTLKERLEYRGIEAEFTTSGNKAMARMREKAFDVVVVDVKMPGISGLDVVKFIKKEHPKTPVILITGHGNIVEEQVEVPEGVFDYLPKPVNLDVLIEKMREAVES